MCNSEMDLTASSRRDVLQPLPVRLPNPVPCLSQSDTALGYHQRTENRTVPGGRWPTSRLKQSPHAALAPGGDAPLRPHLRDTLETAPACPSGLPVRAIPDGLPAACTWRPR